MDYIEKFRELRKAQGLSQQNVSDAIGVKRSAYAMYEAHTNKMDIDTFAALCRYYHVSADDLLGLRP